MLKEYEKSHLKISAPLNLFSLHKNMENEAEKGVNTIEMLIISF